jgi:hypothetical protein
LDARTRFDLRKKAAIVIGDGSFSGVDIKSKRIYVKDEGAAWPFSNVICQRIVLQKYPRLATDAKHRKKAKQLLKIVHLYYRLDWSAHDIARHMALKPKAVQLRIARVAELAKKIIVENGLTLANGESYYTKPMRSRRGRVLVEAHKVVTNVPADLKFLLSLSDVAIREQALKVLAELDKERQEFDAVCSHDLQMLASQIGPAQSHLSATL